MPFWKTVLEELAPELKSKFKDETNLRSRVLGWIDFRRTSLLKGVTPPLRDGYEELDSAINEWSKIWCQHFAKSHWGFFHTAMQQATEDKIIAYVREELPNILRGMLQEREQELATFTRPPVLAKGSSLEVYQEYVQQLKDGIEARCINGVQVQRTEALVSLVLDHMPGLEKTVLRENKSGDVEGDDLDNEESDQATDNDDSPEESDSEESGDHGDTNDTDDTDNDPDYVVPTNEPDQGSPILGEPITSIRNRLGAALPSIDGATPTTTPRTLNKLQNYEREYERVYRHEISRSAPEPPSTKRKASESVLNATPCVVAKRARTEDPQNHTPGSVASDFSFPSISKLVLPKKPSDSTASASNTQQDQPLAGGDVSAAISGGSAVLGNSPVPTQRRLTQLPDPSYTPSPQERDTRPSSEAQAPRQITFATPHRKKKTKPPGLSQSKPSKGTKHRHDDSDDDESGDEPPRQFRESTADFHAMTPQSRETLLFQAVKAMYRQRRRE